MKSQPRAIRLEPGVEDWFVKTLNRTHKTPTKLFNQILKVYIEFEKDGFLDLNGNKLAKQEKLVSIEAAKQKRIEAETALVRAKAQSKNNPFKEPVVDWGGSLAAEGDELGDGFY